MNIQRDNENSIILRDQNNEEIHPYLTVLSAIEFQQKIIPPRIPELSTHGWDVVIQALKEAVDNLGNPYKVTDTELQIEKDGTLTEVISVESVEDTFTSNVKKTPEMPKVPINVPPSMTVSPATTNKKVPGKTR